MTQPAPFYHFVAENTAYHLRYTWIGWPSSGEIRRSQISIATGRRGFLEENLSGCPEAEARAGAVIE